GDRPAAFARIEDNLDKLQSALADARRESIETARSVARAAAQELAGSGQDRNPLIGGLKDDLRSLQSAATSADARNHATLRAIHETLDKVMTRLGAFERDMALPRPDAPESSWAD